MFYMIEFIDSWSIYLKDTQINLFLDLWVLIFVWLKWFQNSFTQGVSNVK